MTLLLATSADEYARRISAVQSTPVETPTHTAARRVGARA
jgi:hypothetical protein